MASKNNGAIGGSEPCKMTGGVTKSISHTFSSPRSPAAPNNSTQFCNNWLNNVKTSRNQFIDPSKNDPINTISKLEMTLSRSTVSMASLPSQMSVEECSSALQLPKAPDDADKTSNIETWDMHVKKVTVGSSTTISSSVHKDTETKYKTKKNILLDKRSSSSIAPPSFNIPQPSFDVRPDQQSQSSVLPSDYHLTAQVKRKPSTVINQPEKLHPVDQVPVDCPVCGLPLEKLLVSCRCCELPTQAMFREKLPKNMTNTSLKDSTMNEAWFSWPQNSLTLYSPGAGVLNPAFNSYRDVASPSTPVRTRPHPTSPPFGNPNTRRNQTPGCQFVSGLPMPAYLPGTTGCDQPSRADSVHRTQPKQPHKE